MERIRIEIEDVITNAVDFIWIVYKRINVDEVFAINKVIHEISFAFFV